MQTATPIVKHLVLVGGGHSHLAVLKRLGMRPVQGLAVTLISRDINTPYSGSLPGLIAGIYEHDDIHIDLRPLAQFAGVRIIQEEITEIDLVNKRIALLSRPAMDFDILSLNIGSNPDGDLIPGALRHATGIKPISEFLLKWREILKAAVSSLKNQDTDFTLVIVGGGPASVELAFSVQVSIYRQLGISLMEKSKLKIQIISADDDVLKSHNQAVRNFTRSEFKQRRIELVVNSLVTEFKANTVICENGVEYSADAIVFATGAKIPRWPADCGLSITADGFIEVNNHLQSTSHEFVFAAGDAATIKGANRPKSGVYAVRQGKPLAENLIRFATARNLKTYRPQQHALALMSMGDKKAIASRNNLFFKGSWVWHLKHRIDTAFLKKYSELPVMSAPLNLAKGLVDKQVEEQLSAHALRCAGCGAKVAGNVLEEVLQQLPDNQSADVLSGHTSIEDASMIKMENGQVLLQSVDQLKAFTNDVWLFAKIATNHCLSDIYAMGANPHSALAVVGLPFATKKYAKSQLKELMLACSETLQENDCELIGGHSAESSELHFGLCVNGFIEEEKILSKGGLREGDSLILTKPLGTGTLLASDMRYRASHRNITGAFQHMAISNKLAVECLIQHNAKACTDVTGFGLAGHLAEMLSEDNVSVELWLDDIPAMDGALESLQAGTLSSLHQDNKLASEIISAHVTSMINPRYELLFDPQTAGGLLVGIPKANTKKCLRQLRKNGYMLATEIGQVTLTGGEQPCIILK